MKRVFFFEVLYSVTALGVKNEHAKQLVIVAGDDEDMRPENMRRLRERVAREFSPWYLSDAKVQGVRKITEAQFAGSLKRELPYRAQVVSAHGECDD